MTMNIEETKKTVRKMQNVVFKIMCDIDDYCKENHIQYFLSGGTCLGAVRHQGFIPWDDDGDLMMPRKDYIRFIKGFQKKYSGKYGVGSLITDPKWQRPYTRVFDLKTRWKSKLVQEEEMGIFIDVFPIDGVPETHFYQKLFFARLKILSVLRNSAIRIAYVSNEPGIRVKKLLGFFTRPIGARFFAKRIDSIISHYDFDQSRYVACSAPVHYGIREVIHKEDMSSATDLVFNNRSFPAPVGYKTYLSNLYGDYMTIPKDAEKEGYTHLHAWDIQFDE